MKKLPLRRIIVDRGLAPDESSAERSIIAGLVEIPGIPYEKVKPGTLFNPDVELRIKERRRFVSRGGLKLQGALDKFHIKPAGAVCADIGASTGGFSDCLLQNGAAKIYAIDVAYGKFDYTLRDEPHIVLFERTNFKYFDFSMFKEKIDIFVIDVSFISVKTIFRKLKEYFKNGNSSEIVCLIKPQFEADKKYLRKGIVLEGEAPRILSETIRDIEQLGYEVVNEMTSPIKGHKGNIEYLALVKPQRHKT